MTILDICIIVIVFLLGINLKNFFKGFTKRDKRFLNYLFFYHIAIALFFHFYITEDGGDAIYYWSVPKENSLSVIVDWAMKNYGTAFMYLLNYFPSKVLSLSFLTGNLLYALFGYLGFVYILKILKHFFTHWESIYDIKLLGISIFPWIWFLPNFHFWTSGIGKDTLLFTCIVMIIYAVLKLRTRWYLLLIASVLTFAVRPHILLFLVVSLGAGLILDGRMKVYQKLFLTLLALAFLVLILDKVLAFVQLENLESSAISEYASKRSSSLNKVQTGSGIDTSSYPFPLKVFTFLYRPLFFDIKGILFLLASLENLILLLFSVVIIFKKPLRAFKKGNYVMKAGLFFFLISTMAFSLILGNLGIMLRQKNMLMPWLVIFGLWTLFIHLKKTDSYAVVDRH